MSHGKGAGIGRRKAVEIRRRKARALQPMIIGITWYRPEDYDRLKAMFPDGDKLPDNFEEWTKQVQKVTAVLKSEGFQIKKVLLDPEIFPQWCRARGLEMNAKTRTEYAREVAGAAPAPMVSRD
jgi:hypothetical protein